MSIKVAFSGGGTGGHIYPALAIREILTARFGSKLECAFIGTETGLESKIVRRIPDIDFMTVRAQGMPRTASMKWLTFPIVNFLGMFDALRHLRSFRPSVVITTGGYVSFPVLFASKLLGIPSVIHEQNAVMGLTNRLFASSARLVLLTYGEACPVDDIKYFLTGNPVRKEFLQASDRPGMFSKKEGEKCILFVGGSGGARSINTACCELVEKGFAEKAKVHILHISGEREFETIKNRMGERSGYTLMPYLHEMRMAFDMADLLVSRAGATILAEISVCAKPALLIPYPYATDNHQEKNARALEASGAAKVILDRELNGTILEDALNKILHDSVLAEMSEAMKASRPLDVEERIFRCLEPLFADG